MFLSNAVFSTKICEELTTQVREDQVATHPRCLNCHRYDSTGFLSYWLQNHPDWSFQASLPLFRYVIADLASLIPNLMSEFLWLILVADDLRWKFLHYQGGKALFVLVPKILTRTETTLLLHVLIKCGILDENLWGIDIPSERESSCRSSFMQESSAPNSENESSVFFHK